AHGATRNFMAMSNKDFRRCARNGSANAGMWKRSKDGKFSQSTTDTYPFCTPSIRRDAMECRMTNFECRIQAGRTANSQLSALNSQVLRDDLCGRGPAKLLRSSRMRAKES